MIFDEIEKTIAHRFPSIRALLIHDSRHGEHIYETEPHAIRQLHGLASIAKSVTALLVGRAIKDDFFSSPDEVLLSHFPSLVTGDAAMLRTVSLTRLLTMTSGMIWDEHTLDIWARSAEKKFPMRFDVDSARVGAFSYNTAGSHLAGAILAEITGRPLDVYARETLLAPLGIETIAWTKDPQGYCFGGHALRLCPVDCLTLSSLLLTRDDGKNAPLLPDTWMRECATPRALGDWPFHLQYGYSWWITPWGHMAFGYGGQVLALNPRLHRALVICSEKDALHEEYYTELVEPLMTRMESR